MKSCHDLDCFPQTLSFFSVSGHRSAAPNSLQTYVGTGLEGKTAGRGRGGDRSWGEGREMDTVFREPLNPRLSALTDHSVTWRRLVTETLDLPVSFCSRSNPFPRDATAAGPEP